MKHLLTLSCAALTLALTASCRDKKDDPQPPTPKTEETQPELPAPPKIAPAASLPALLPPNAQSLPLSFTTEERPQAVKLLDPESTWLTLSASPEGTYTLALSANAEWTKRSTQIEVDWGSTKQVLELTQEGTRLYTLPLLTPSATAEEVEAYELGRGASKRTLPAGVSGVYQFDYPQKDLFDGGARYTYRRDAPGYYNAVTKTILQPQLIWENADFEAFLKEHGFAFDKRNAQGRLFLHTSLPLRLLITEPEDDEFLTLTYAYIPRQMQAQATFTSLPLQEQVPYLANLFRAPASAGTLLEAGVLQQERDQYQSTLLSEGTEAGKRSFFRTGSQHLAGEAFRAYNYYQAGTYATNILVPAQLDHSISSVELWWADWSKGFYHDAQTGKYLLTQEVKDFFRGLGYSHTTFASGAETFYRVSDHYAYTLSMQTWQEKPYLVLTLKDQSMNGLN